MKLVEAYLSAGKVQDIVITIVKTCEARGGVFKSQEGSR